MFLASTIVPGDDLLVGLQICHLYGFENQIQNFSGAGRATTQSLGRPSLAIPTLVSLEGSGREGAERGSRGAGERGKLTETII